MNAPANTPQPIAQEKHGAVTIMKSLHRTPARQLRVLARCKCGKEFETLLHNVRAGRVKSCGCGIHRVKPTMQEDRKRLGYI